MAFGNRPLFLFNGLLSVYQAFTGFWINTISNKELGHEKTFASRWLCMQLPSRNEKGLFAAYRLFQAKHSFSDEPTRIQFRTNCLHYICDIRCSLIRSS